MPAALLAALTLLLALLLPAAAELSFPPLSGRVVDAAGILDAATTASLDSKLAAHEAKNGDQLVVATVPSLQGTSVEDYANQLFRHWQLGQAKINNGVLLLVAPNDRKVRIEVGYGLEGVLTDAVAATIISTVLVPAFRAGDFPGGAAKGADAILEILNLDPEEAARRASAAGAVEGPILGLMRDQWLVVFFLVVMAVFWIVVFVRIFLRPPGKRLVRTPDGRMIIWPAGISRGNPRSSWSSSSRSSSGGFSGGGGSSGGGGASGSW
ncbi:MAG TPA: TPM domain-containing protein [Xanthobacteraceae bacterium]|nr:TPM domain-containing protein [Xanthobacteraceae bacterium]